ncbi:MAG: nuclear transport factor 2 family protein [Bacteroidia bacterium]|nr:nuclear transport factor 2 family protein [Bacteroidia bacterium]
MMLKYVVYTLPILFLSLACSPKSNEDAIEKWKEEITKTELSFAKLAQKEGVEKAFLTFAAPDAVLSRNNTILKGKEEIRQYFQKQTLQDVILQWSPDFVDVSASGDLGYTYGKFTFSAKDTIGNLLETEGIFHTVWKRQDDGTWKFVWD